MHIVPPGGFVIPPRLKFDQIVGTDIKPLEKPLRPRRLKIVCDSAIRGTLIFKSSIFEFDTSGEGREDYSLLISCLKGVPVPLDTPLVTMAAQTPPPPMPAPEKAPTLRELVIALTASLKTSNRQCEPSDTLS
jgi:hypothetical protein